MVEVNKMDALMALEREVYMPTFKRQPMVLARGEGCYVWDEDGKRYLDLVAGIAVNVLGHGHPGLVQAVRDQAGSLMHTSNLYYNRPQVEFAEMLVKWTGMEKVFFTNSGAEANETAIKLARKFGKRHRGGAFAILTATMSFHGRTLTALAATGQPKYQAPFTPLPPGFAHVPFNDIEAIRQATTAETVAVLLEPIQGESGIHPAERQYLLDVRAWCDERGLLLILDEIQSGIGRTGTFLAGEGYGVRADIVTLAKGICGGLPAGATLANGDASSFEAGDHGSTMGGGPLVCTAGIATMTAIQEQDLMGNAASTGAYLLKGLEQLMRDHASIARVRGRGLMAALDLNEDWAADLVGEARVRGLLVNATGPSTVRMVPALTISTKEVDEGLAIVDEVLRAR
jgi:acetylornithine/N-succinyldiaminopimelate aminotransferase